MVASCLNNVQEWLQKHTWICYYIRDGQGRLRPIWDANKTSPDPMLDTTEAKWKGYMMARNVSEMEIVMQRSQTTYSSPPSSDRRTRRDSDDDNVSFYSRQRHRQQRHAREYDEPYRQRDRPVEREDVAVRSYPPDIIIEGMVEEDADGEQNGYQIFDDYGRTLRPDMAEKNQKR